MAHCPQCNFDDSVELEKKEIDVRFKRGEIKQIVISIVLCRTCGNIYGKNWKDCWE